MKLLGTICTWKLIDSLVNIIGRNVTGSPWTLFDLRWSQIAVWNRIMDNPYITKQLDHEVVWQNLDCTISTVIFLLLNCNLQLIECRRFGRVSILLVTHLLDSHGLWKMIHAIAPDITTRLQHPHSRTQNAKCVYSWSKNWLSSHLPST